MRGREWGDGVNLSPIDGIGSSTARVGLPYAWPCARVSFCHTIETTAYEVSGNVERVPDRSLAIRVRLDRARVLHSLLVSDKNAAGRRMLPP